MRLKEILEKVSSYIPEDKQEIIKKAYVLSARVHKDQTRLSGEPYLNHPIATALILADLKMDENTIAAGLLHDVLEDTLTTYEELVTIFGEEVAQLVDGVTKISKIQFSGYIERKAENYRKMLLAMSKDIRVIIIKLADRLHNMQTLQYQTKEKQENIARETLEIYTPIANRLGMSKLKAELEDLAFKYVAPEVYNNLKEELDKILKEREAYVEKVKNIITEVLEEHGIKARVSGRQKHIYSLHQKMERQKVGLDQIYDLIAFRIIVDDEKDCYATLGIIHSQWKPIPGRFKDYIAVPKANMYQSLHTTVIGPESERIEIQIRTEAMHRIAEYGIAAHWKYKEGKVKPLKEEERFAWLRQILELQQDTKDAKDFIETVKTDLFTDEVYVFTPKGEVKALPKGSTPVDFAYAIHSDVGSHCIGAKVNGRIVPLRHQLATGDIVEIITSPQQRPSPDWLKFVKTSKAKTKIRQILKQHQYEKSIEIGREVLDKLLKKHDLALNKLSKQELSTILKNFKLKSEEELFSSIGFGKLSPMQIIHEIKPEIKQDFKPIELVSQKAASKEGIIIKELDGVMIRFGKCCNPLPGDNIIGFISRGRGITVHLADCPNILNADPQRIIEVSWDTAKKIVRPTKIVVYCVDEPGLLSNISSAISALNINISEGKIYTTPDKRAVCTFEVLVTDTDQLSKVMQAVGRVKGVYATERLK